MNVYWNSIQFCTLIYYKIFTILNILSYIHYFLNKSHHKKITSNFCIKHSILNLDFYMQLISNLHSINHDVGKGISSSPPCTHSLCNILTGFVPLFCSITIFSLETYTKTCYKINNKHLFTTNICLI